jgi:hypothetical protein
MEKWLAGRLALRQLASHLESSQADVAQLVEQSIRNRQVSGSTPLVGSKFHAGLSDVCGFRCTTFAHQNLRTTMRSSRFIAAFPCLRFDRMR